jgi:hypothetical protein
VYDHIYGPHSHNPEVGEYARRPIQEEGSSEHIHREAVPATTFDDGDHARRQCKWWLALLLAMA